MARPWACRSKHPVRPDVEVFLQNGRWCLVRGTRASRVITRAVAVNSDQPVTSSSSTTIATPCAIHAAPTTASRSVPVRTWSARMTVLPLV